MYHILNDASNVQLVEGEAERALSLIDLVLHIYANVNYKASCDVSVCVLFNVFYPPARLSKFSYLNAVIFSSDLYPRLED